MDRALYIAMTGAAQTMRAQAVNSHNLANASTTGFKAELAAQQAVAVDGPLLPSRVNTQLAGLGFDDAQGPIQATGNPLDVALDPGRWLAVQGPDGREGYTRAGDLQIGADGLLRTSAGALVLGDGGSPLSIPPQTQISLGGDGTLTVQPQGQSAAAPVVVGRLKVVSAAASDLVRADGGLMAARPGTSLSPAAGKCLTAGALEGSNVSLAESMTTMIQLARNYELQVKMMKAADENAQASSSLLRMG